MKKTLEEQIAAFLSGEPRSRWLDDGVVKLYLRKGSLRLLEGNIYDALDLGRIEVAPAHQRQGRAKAAIALLEKLNPYDAVFVENAAHPKLHAALRRWGWKESPNYPWCFYQFTPHLKWTCHICGKERLDRFISVFTTDLSDQFAMPPGTFKQNCRYCNDDPVCMEIARTYRFLPRNIKP